MAISFGRRGTGGSGGSSRVGFVEGRQNSTAITINNHASNFTNPTYTTRSWQLTNKDGGKAEIVFSSLITISNGASTTNVRYSADLQVASYSTLNNSPSNTDFIDIPNLVPSNGNLIFDDLQHYDNEASFYHTISGAIPFNLSVLPSSVANNRYLNFRVRLRVSADGSPTIQATNGYVVLKSFGVGAGSTDINGGDIRDGTITANELANNSVTRPKIINDAINGDKIADDAVGNEHIATDAVRADQIQDNAVVEAKIANNAVTADKIDADAVTQSKIADGAVDSNRLADGAVSPSKIAGVNVSGASAGQVLKLNTAKTGFDFADDNNSGGGGGGTPADGSITTDKLANDAVTNAKLANNAVQTANIVNDAITNALIANNAVQTAQISDDSVTNAKLADDAVDTDQIADDAVTGSKIANGTIGSLQIGDGTIGSAKLLDDSVTTAKIADGAVTGVKIATGSVGANTLMGMNEAGFVRYTPTSTATTTGTGFTYETSWPATGGQVRYNSGVSRVEINWTGLTRPDIVVGTDLTVTVGSASVVITVATITNSGFNGVWLYGYTATPITSGTLVDGASASITYAYSVPASISSDKLEPADLQGVSTGSGSGGYAIALNSAGTGFEAKEFPSAGGGSIPADNSVTTAKLAADAVTNAKLADDAVQTENVADDAITKALMADNSVGTDQIEDNAVTSAKISGVLPTTKGGTGLNASDISDLRSKLGIGTGGQTDPDLVRSTDADTQKDDTIHRFDSNTSNRPTGATEGIIVRTGDNQWMINVADGKTWTRTLSNTGASSWSTPVAAVLTGNTPDLERLQTESDFRTFAESDQGWTDTTNWLPQFSDGSRPTKVLVGRNGNYLVAIDRNNFFWAPRPTVSTWTEIPWRWEGTSTIPSGLRYTGGENDERLIPAGEDAVIAGKTNIPGENFVALLVDHSVSGTTSTFTGFYVDDDADKTLRKTTNTLGNSGGTWNRVMLDEDGIASNAVSTNKIEDEAVTAAKIDNDIITTDASSNEPVFLGIVPSIDDITFTGYEFNNSLSNVTAGKVGWDSTNKVLRVVKKTGSDDHLPDIFQEDYEVEIRVSDTHYIRGVFGTPPSTPPGVVQARYRTEDLQEIGGTIADGTTVEIKGHKSVITKNDDILPVNLGLGHGSSEANKFIRYNSSGNAFAAQSTVATADIADDAVTAAKIAGVDISSGDSGKVIAVNSAEDGLELVDQSGGTPAANSITNAMLQDNIITPAEVAGVTASGNGGKVVAINTAGNAFELVEQSGGSGDAAVVLHGASTATDGRETFTTRATWTGASFHTNAWQLANKSTGTATIIPQGRLSFSGGTASSLILDARLQVRWADTADGTYSSWAVVTPVDGVNDISQNDEHAFYRFQENNATTFGLDKRFLPLSFPLSNLPSGATDGKYLQFRLYIRPNWPSSGLSSPEVRINSCALSIIIPNAASSGGGGGGTPADGSITTAKLADDAVTIPDKVATVYDDLVGTYAFQGYNQVTLNAGQIGATTITNGRAQIQFELQTTDTDAKAHFAATGYPDAGEVAVLHNSDGSKYLAIRVDTRNQQDNDFGLTGDVLYNEGTFTVNESVSIYYGSKDGVLRTNALGKLFVDDIKLPPAVDVPTIARTADYTYVTSAPSSNGQLRFYTNTTPTPDQWEMVVDFLGGADVAFSGIISAATTSGHTLIINKDEKNFISFVPESSSGSGTVTVVARAGSVKTKGSIANNDTVNVSVQPETFGEVVGHSIQGDNIQLLRPGLSLYRLIAKQSSDWSPANPVQTWRRWPYETGIWQLKGKEFDWMDFEISGVFNCGGGAVQAINPRVRGVCRWSSTISGLSSATWTAIDIYGTTQGSGQPDELFRSKVAAGGSGNAQFRDYFVASGRRPFKLSQLPSGVSNDDYIQFGFEIQQEDSAFATISSVRNCSLVIDILDGSRVHYNLDFV